MILLFLLLVLFPAFAWAQQCTQAQLNTEFTTDPTGRTYATCPAGNDQCVLDKFNAPCTVAACKADRIVTREQVYEVIDKDELKTLADVSLNDTTALGSRLRRLLMAFDVATFDLSKASVRQKLNDLFPAAQAPLTNAAFDALRQRDASRAHIVCGRQGTLSDVSLGLRGAQ